MAKMPKGGPAVDAGGNLTAAFHHYLASIEALERRIGALETVTDPENPEAPPSLLETANLWQKTQTHEPIALTFGATLNWDWQAGKIAAVTMADDATLSVPTNIGAKAGTWYLYVYQGSSPYTLAFAEEYLFPGGVIPDLTTDPGALDVFKCTFDGEVISVEPLMDHSPPRFPRVVDSSTGTSTALSHTHTLQTGIQAGDLLLFFGSAQLGSSVTFSVFAPDGWDNLWTYVGGGNLRQFFCFGRVANGMEKDVLMIAGAGSPVWQTMCVRIDRTHARSPVEYGTSATGNSVSPNPPSISPSWGATKKTLIAAVMAHIGTGAPTTPTDYTDQIHFASASGSISVAFREVEAASEDPGVFTISSNQWAANTIAIRGQ